MIKVLLIEDDPSQIFIYEAAFALNDLTTTSVAHFQEALEKIKMDKPDIILLDIVLSEDDGLVFLEKFKQNDLSKDIPVVMFTNSSGMELQKKAFALGALDFIIKSQATPSETAEKIKKILEKLER